MDKCPEKRRFWLGDEKMRIVAMAWVSGDSVSEVARSYDANASHVF